jgi:hypothetical protein
VNRVRKYYYLTEKSYCENLRMKKVLNYYISSKNVKILSSIIQILSRRVFVILNYEVLDLKKVLLPTKKLTDFYYKDEWSIKLSFNK